MEQMRIALPPKLRVYLDTSVLSAYLDDRLPQRQDDTRQFWERREEFELCTSTIAQGELRRTEPEALRQRLLEVLAELTLYELTAEMRQLASLYVRHGVFTWKMRRDALHVAAATLLRQDVLVSWNFAHLVNRRRRVLLSQMNADLGLRTPEILAPPEL